MKKQFNRRSFLKRSLLATGGMLLVPNFISCSNDDDLVDEFQIPDDLNETNFDSGVASFDPTQSQVIIWTRYTTNLPSVSLMWQLARDSNFEDVVRSGKVVTDGSRDFTVAVEVQNLESNQKLYYRFANVQDVSVSVIGETITLPRGSVNEVRLGVTSCANFAAGLFNVYNAMANSDIDLVIHLGDYIYEYGENEYGTNVFTEPLGRTHSPVQETISLDDYRRRYKQYRGDEDLKLLHQRKPFICVWDDHEIANDTYKEGAENHQESEGDFESRKQNALKAYSEYLPAKTNDISIIYRSFQIGNLVNLVMLDTRLIGRDKQLNLGSYVDANTGSFDLAAFQYDWLKPDRTLLGSTQRNWLLNEIGGNAAEWQVIGQQVLMGKMYIPAELVFLFATLIAEMDATGEVSQTTMATFHQRLTELSELKTRAEGNDSTLTTKELARINTVLPYNLDAWDGYPVEREMLLESFANKKVVVLAGDTHNAWYNDIVSNSGNVSIKEFATASVTSPGFEKYIGTNPIIVSGFQYAIKLLIDGLNYLNAAKRGYMKVTFTQGTANSEWIFLDTVFSQEYVETTGFVATV